MRRAFLLLAAVVVGSLAVPAVACGASPSLSSLMTMHVPAGFVATATGDGRSDQPTTTDPRAQSGQVPISPELYLRVPATTTTGATLPTLWRLWWDPATQQALTVSLAQYSNPSMAATAISQLNADLTGSVGNSGLSLTSVFVPQGLPGAHGYNLAAATSATPTKSPFTVSAVLFHTGSVEYLDTILAAGTEPATGAVSSFALAQYHSTVARPLVHPVATASHPASIWPWIAGGAALVLLVLAAFVARRRAVVRRRRRHRHSQQRRPRGTPGLRVGR